jgi:hypothetical protein
MTAGQRWRRRRNLVLFAVYRRPFGQRLLANVIDLSVTQIGRILLRLSAESGHPLDFASSDGRLAWVKERLQEGCAPRAEGRDLTDGATG